MRVPVHSLSQWAAERALSCDGHMITIPRISQQIRVEWLQWRQWRQQNPCAWPTQHSSEKIEHISQHCSSARAQIPKRHDQIGGQPGKYMSIGVYFRSTTIKNVCQSGPMLYCFYEWNAAAAALMNHVSDTFADGQRCGEAVLRMWHGCGSVADDVVWRMWQSSGCGSLADVALWRIWRLWQRED